MLEIGVRSTKNICRRLACLGGKPKVESAAMLASFFMVSTEE